MNKTAKKAGAFSIAGLAAAGVAGVTGLIADAFVSEAFAREEPAVIKNATDLLKGYGKGETPPPGMDLDPAPFGFTEERLRSRDGLLLTGHLYVPDAPKRVLLLFHGWRSSWHRDFGRMLPFLTQSGSVLLMPDQRAQQGSEGEYMSFGLLERFDCVDWAQTAAARFPGLPIYLMGISMGASTVLMASGLELPGVVRGIVADCAFTSPAAIAKHVIGNNLRLPYSAVSRRVDRLCRKQFGMRADAADTAEALKKNTRPVLFIHGDADRFVPLSMTEENYAACEAEKELLIVPGAAHARSYLIDPAAYEAKLRDFWAKHDA